VRHSEGGGLAEYALIVALIALIALVALLFMGTQISSILDAIAEAI
jgi:Flp pilus assembly pilin Flp